MLKKCCLTMVCLVLSVACGDNATTPADSPFAHAGAGGAPVITAGTGTAPFITAGTSATAPGTPTTTDAGQTPYDAGTQPPASPPGTGKDDAGLPPSQPVVDAGTPAPSTVACDYEKQTVALAKDLIVPAGKTIHVCSGVTFTAAMDVKIDVLGELIVDGSADAIVSFLGSGKPRSWYGLVVEKGGNLKLSHAVIGGAAYGLYALPGSNFAVDYTVFNTSFKAAIVQSNGSFAHTKFEATTPPTIAITDQVAVDDPNGTLTIINASPSISNSSFDGSSGFTDMVRVGGESSPTFDHVYLHNAHCGFHTFGGTNTSMHVTNAIFENLAYGIMAYTTKPIIEDSVFRQNGNDVGICTGATNANTPILKNNNYKSGSPVIDASCFMIGTTDSSPAATANASAGPSGL